MMERPLAPPSIAIVDDEEYVLVGVENLLK
jgi:hypothetical protein